MTLLSAAVLLFLVMDPFGNVPIFLSVLRHVGPERRRRVIIRESLIALAVLLIFLLFGPALLRLMGLEETALQIAGGVVLFLIALRMIFPQPGGIFGPMEEAAGEDPLVVPLAIPLLAGPSAIAIVMLMATQDPDALPAWIGAILIAWAGSLTVLLMANPLANLLGRRGLIALERLMGLLLAVIAVQMFLTGVEQFIHETGPATPALLHTPRA